MTLNKIKMKKNIYLVALTMLSLFINAQTYTYQWAKTGGGSNGSSGVGFNQLVDEQVLDMVTDSQNNTYYLVPMYQVSPLLNGQPATNYGGKNIVLFSTDCQGNIRWSRAIGSATNSAFSQKIALDNNGGLYITFFGANTAFVGQSDLPIRFGDNETMPYGNSDPFVAEAAKRTSFLLKYNTADGNFIWRRDFQGDVSILNNNSDVGVPIIDSQNIIHVIVGFKFGTHLNGLVTVPAAFDNNTPKLPILSCKI